MIEVDVVAFDDKGICVAIKRITINEWRTFKKKNKFVYRAFQVGFHACEVGR